MVEILLDQLNSQDFHNLEWWKLYSCYHVQTGTRKWNTLQIWIKLGTKLYKSVVRLLRFKLNYVTSTTTIKNSEEVEFRILALVSLALLTIFFCVPWTQFSLFKMLTCLCLQNLSFLFNTFPLKFPGLGIESQIYLQSSSSLQSW